MHSVRAAFSCLAIWFCGLPRSLVRMGWSAALILVGASAVARAECALLGTG
jgi:hypothetical protein